jgi:F-type H+-transporting ATPase subunit delta
MSRRGNRAPPPSCEALEATAFPSRVRLRNPLRSVSFDIAAARYARAVFAIAVDEGSIPSWSSAVETLGALTSEKRFVYALSRVEDGKLQSIVREVHPGVTQPQLNLFRLLHRKRRLALGPAIASRFTTLAEEHDGVVRADIRTAVELDAVARASVVERLSTSLRKRVLPQFTVDETLLGGLTIQVGDRKFDGSVRAQLRELRHTLSAQR